MVTIMLTLSSFSFVCIFSIPGNGNACVNHRITSETFNTKFAKCVHGTKTIYIPASCIVINAHFVLLRNLIALGLVCQALLVQANQH